MNKLIIITLLFYLITTTGNWFSYQGFNKNYYFSESNLKLKLTDAINNDINTPFFFIRSYHNKFTFTVMEVARIYLMYWDIIFLVALLSPFGVFGFIMGLWYFTYYRYRSKLLLSVIVLICVFQTIEIFIKPDIIFPIKILIFSLPYQLVSYFGISRMIIKREQKKIYIILLIFIWLTIIWKYSLFSDPANFCLS